MRAKNSLFFGSGICWIFILASLLIFVVLGGSGCATAVKCRSHTATPYPDFLPVNVVNGTVTGEDLDNLIINWLRVNEDNHLLRKEMGEK